MPVNIYRKTNFSQDNGNGLEFTVSDNSPDRIGDVIEASGWNLKEFEKNPIALFNHNPDFPIGKWKNTRVVGNKLKSELVLAPLGTSPRIDELIRLVAADIMQTVSVGFIPDEYRQLPNGGTRFIKQRLVEISLTPTPANPNALRTKARSLGVRESTIAKLIDQAPLNASISQRADHARQMMKGEKKVESTEAMMKRINAKVRNEMAARERAKDREQDRLDAEILACGNDYEKVFHVVMRQEAERQKRHDVQLAASAKRKTTRKVEHMSQLLESAKRKGCDTEAMMRSWLKNIK